ncbi:MAG: methyltransferase domain-containing protein [Desulfobulbaceae bacterium]|nr:methyltransferase domain-containing protein [Desulfobulbaceae bacterium]
MKKRERHAEIFVDIEEHIETGRFIRDHSLNRTDIRDFTFADVDLSRCKDVLDLGCSYGFFIKGLAGRLDPGALINGVDLWEECEKYYLDACRKSGYPGRFCLSDEVFCSRYPDQSFDLVLCSYALYFFPEAIPDIARVLRPNGLFITITHAMPHMQELINIVGDLLKKHTGCPAGPFPLEELMDSFSSANGCRLLSPWFREICEKKYVNSLRIDAASLPGLIRYICFKKPLFFPDGCMVDDRFIETVLAAYFRDLLAKHEFLTISKDDTVYICRYPHR